MRLSIIINFYNMRREAMRTLYSVSRDYQHDVEGVDYEVIAIDNGSTQSLAQHQVEQFGSEFSYRYFKATNPSPCQAMNAAIEQAQGNYVMCCIDGARMLAPGIIHQTLKAAQLYSDPFIYTLGMHLGSQPQNISIESGYNQVVEDTLLESIDWRKDGYSLFDISSVALSSKNGFFSELSESNSFAMKKQSLLVINGFDEQFCSAGGGLVNLDLFNRVHQSQRFAPIMLLGEATFHQFHGGVATNVSMQQHPWPKMEEEYQRIRNQPYATIYRPPVYFGHLPAQCTRFLNA
jgi:glycosyltransferase involved in cell wall biosynthesis